ncbi:MAG: sigma-70 family RNA polymerase sigma factor, partial [Kofleriaceae bacterium]|nr:sigma-70 family RNA polymerase sigma factor [Kofleriaceae bacterium]
MHAAAARHVVEPVDELTLRRAQRGDERAWRDLIARFQQPVHALVWRMLGGRAKHRAEDLTQETFVRVLKALPRFDPGGPASLSTWILTIATRLVLNELRKPEPAGLEREPVGRERADGDAERRRLGAAIAAGIG